MELSKTGKSNAIRVGQGRTATRKSVRMIAMEMEDVKMEPAFVNWDFQGVLVNCLPAQKNAAGMEFVKKEFVNAEKVL
jgi:hypothetical protein